MKKSVLLVGAAGGVGMATAVSLATSGYRVIAVVLNEQEAKALRRATPAVNAIHCVDLSNADQAKQAIEAIVGGLDAPLDAVVICSGIAYYGPVETGSLDTLRRIIEINTIAVVALFQATIAHLRKTRGRFVVVSSSAGMVPFPLFGFYSASKHALEGLADAMRMETRQWGVEVCLVEPGGIRTAMVTNILQTIEQRIATLPAVERQHYGALFENYRKAVVGDEPAYQPPEQVAACLVSALEAAAPDTRRVVGNDAVAVVRLKRELSDRDLDAIFLGHGSSNVPAEPVAKSE